MLMNIKMKLRSSSRSLNSFKSEKNDFWQSQKKYQIKIDMMEQILEAKRNEGASDTPSADSNATFTEFKLKYEAEIKQLKNVIKQNRQEILSKEEHFRRWLKSIN